LVEDREPEICQIETGAQLDNRWIDGLWITCADQDMTVVTGPSLDQPCLQGLSVKLRDLGLPPISVNSADTRERRGQK